MGNEIKALSVQRIRKAAKKAKKAEPGLDAMWATAGWLVPTQALALSASGLGLLAGLGVAMGVSVGLALITPFVAGIVEAFTTKPNADRAAWVMMVGLCGTAWSSAGGAVTAVALVIASLLLFVVYHRRYQAREARATHGGKLPAGLAEQITALPGDMPKALRSRVDRALASIESLHTLRDELPDGEALWRDAITCTERVLDRTGAALRLHALPQQGEAIERAKHDIEDQLDALTAQLSAAVDAAIRFTALARDDGREELAERAESLHALVEATREVEDALR